MTTTERKPHNPNMDDPFAAFDRFDVDTEFTPDLDEETADGTASICRSCGDTYHGTYCEVCTPCDDCDQIPALCRCESYSTDPID